MALPSRRSVLKWTLASGVLAFGGGAALALQKTQLRELTPKLVALDASAYAVLCALADRLCPALGEGAPGALALQVPEQIDAMLLASPDESVREQIVGALMMLENALSGALFLERFQPFTKLDAAGQDAVLAHMRDSSVGVRRTVFRALTTVVNAFYWAQPDTWLRAGYGGPPETADLREMYKDQLVDLDSLRATPLVQGA
ncbi:MAG: gluconate 2-dehydrogenase subunit 3 family protein [Polyangiales bacterium]